MKSIHLPLLFFALGLVACGEEASSDSGCPSGQVSCDGVCIDSIAADADAIHGAVLAGSCAFSSCHSGAAAREGLDLSSGAALRNLVDRPSAQDPSRKLVDKGSPAQSYLVDKLLDRSIAATDSRGGKTTAMPPDAPLCEPKVAAIEAWIEAGAP